MTPGLDGPIVPGIMRGLVLEQAQGLATDDSGRGRACLAPDWKTAEEVFLTNAVPGDHPRRAGRRDVGISSRPRRTPGSNGRLPAPGRNGSGSRSPTG